MENYCLLPLLKKGDKVSVVGTPAFHAWSKKNKKGNAVIHGNDAELFTSQSCVARLADIYIV